MHYTVQYQDAIMPRHICVLLIAGHIMCTSRSNASCTGKTGALAQWIYYIRQSLKMHGPIFSKFSFLFHLMIHHSKDLDLKFQLKQSSGLMYEAILYIAVAYISCCVSLIMVTITRHIFISIFQTEQFSAAKFVMGYAKNMSFLVIPKSSKVRKKLKKKSDWAPLSWL